MLPLQDRNAMHTWDYALNQARKAAEQAHTKVSVTTMICNESIVVDLKAECAQFKRPAGDIPSQTHARLAQETVPWLAKA